MTLFLVAWAVVATVFALTLFTLDTKRSDLLAGLRHSMTYEAIALYDIDGTDPIFQWVPNVFSSIVGQSRQPEQHERHWNYWEWFKETREDWDIMIRRAIVTGRPEIRENDVLIYPNGERVALSWACGPRYDAGRPWRRPRICGFYITHVRLIDVSTPLAEISKEVDAMKKKNRELEEMVRLDEAEFTARTLSRLAQRVHQSNPNHERVAA